MVARRAHCVPATRICQRPSRARPSPMSKHQALTRSSGAGARQRLVPRRPAMQRRRRHHPDQRVHRQTAQRVGHHRLHPSRRPAREPQPPSSTRTARPRPPHQESPGKERPRGLKRPRSPRMAATAPDQRSPVQVESPRQESPRPSQPPTAVQRQPKPPPPRVRSLPAPPPAQRRCLLCRPQLRRPAPRTTPATAPTPDLRHSTFPPSATAASSAAQREPRASCPRPRRLGGALRMARMSACQGGKPRRRARTRPPHSLHAWTSSREGWRPCSNAWTSSRERVDLLLVATPSAPYKQNGRFMEMTTGAPPCGPSRPPGLAPCQMRRLLRSPTR